MYADRPSSVFLVYANPGSDGDEKLAAWYLDVHGPDSIRGGTFSALHRYEALGECDARFLALWDGSFTTAQEARDRILPLANERRNDGRVSVSQQAVWTDMYFLEGDDPPPGGGDPLAVATMTIVEGGPTLTDEELVTVLGPAGRRYSYGALAFYESPDPLDVVAARWAGRGKSGLAPHGLYRSLFEAPDTFLLNHPEFADRWISHWRPIASLRAADLD